MFKSHSVNSKNLALFCAVGLLIFGMSLGHAQSRPSQFEDFKGDGYYWYKKDPEPKPVKPPEKKPVTPAPTSALSTEPKPLSAAWIRANIKKLLDTAIDAPTKENVTNYMYAQRIILDKSQNFSEMAKEVVGTDPFLDENNRSPIASFAQNPFARGITAAKESAMRDLGAKAGLWVFVDHPEKCSACEGYVSNILEGLPQVPGVANKYKFHFRKVFVTSEGGKAAAKRLNLRLTPTTVMVLPPNKYFLVSQGLMAQDQLVDRILLVAKSEGLLTKDQLETINPYNKDVLTTEQMKDLPENQDPSDVMKSLRERIGVINAPSP